MTRKKNSVYLLICFGFSAIFMGICSKSSPLYPMNDWVDVNCFFTVGKSILHGLVPYADLYEQKGPLLYFLYAIAALISQRSFLGVYLLDTVSFGLFLFYCGKIARLYLGDRPIIWVAILILGAVIPTSRAFSHGSSVELLSLWMLLYPLYLIVLCSREKRTLKFWEAFRIGLCAAGVLYIKFTIVGFFLGLCVYVALWYLLRDKKPLELLKTIGAFLGGMAALSAVIFGYFLIFGAVREFCTVYFYNNLFLYPNESPNRFLMIVMCLYSTFNQNSGYGWFILIGWLWFIFSRFNDGKTFSAFTLSFLGLAVGTYWGGRGYTYYGLVFAVYAIFGLLGLLEAGLAIYRLIQRKKPFRYGSVVSWVLVGLLAVAMPFYSLKHSRNAYLMPYRKADMPQYQFAEVIDTVEDAKLLNYGFLDGGFYFTSGTVPVSKFFCTLNINLNEMWAEHRALITNGEVDFVVTRDRRLEEYSLNASHYTCVATASMYFEGAQRTYYLYQLK